MEKRKQDITVLRDLHPKVKQEVFDNKSNFYDRDGTNLSDKYELIMKTTKEQSRALKGKDELERHEMENGKFIFAFFEGVKLLEERFETLSSRDIARLMLIGTYVAWETNRLQSDNGKKALKKKDIAELVKISSRRFNELYNRYVKEGVMVEGESGQLFLDSTVIYRGSMKKLGSKVDGLNHTRVFRKTVRELYDKFNGRKIGQLALVYSIIPFLNFDSNLVCYNPSETDANLAEPINIKQLAELLGYTNEAKLTAALNGISVNEIPMFTYVINPHNRRDKRVIVNPRIIFAGNGESLNQFKKLFN